MARHNRDAIARPGFSFRTGVASLASHLTISPSLDIALGPAKDAVQYSVRPFCIIMSSSASILRGLRTSRGAVITVFVLFVLALVYLLHPALSFWGPEHVTAPWTATEPATEPATGIQAAPVDQALVDDLVQYFTDYPLNPPYKQVFGELGRRTRILRDWLVWVEQSSARPSDKAALEDAVERVVTGLYPFLENPPKNPNSRTPLADLRSTYQAGSVGIVIPTGDGTLRFAAHLVGSLRSVLGSSLPIQIAYAGAGDLSPANRARLASIIQEGPALEFLDITAVFDDSTLRFGEESGGWATKAFAALGSRFEKVILLDADAVFLQAPEVLLRHPAFQRTGAFLFHDRLLWQHAFADRHAWWKDQIRRPSATLDKSLVWTEDYAEEGDSGVVVVDKGRTDVLMGLLHICWQNTYAVREEVTYKITYGDKESWWLGFELAGSSYEMERHYGAIVGWEQRDERGKSKVCSFVIAHVDDSDKLLWYNGGLLKNKMTSDVEYEVPLKWMIDAEWQKGATKRDMSCMVGGEVRSLTGEEIDVLKRTIELAQELDKEFNA